MEVAIVFIVIIFGSELVRKLLRHRREMRELELQHLQVMQTSEENTQLQEEVAGLKSRVEVLEKIVTDKKFELKKEIEAL